MIPVHIWLPEAHVEAPTAGSVILAGILLKMGTYGLLRFSIPLFPEATIFYQPLVFLMSIIGILYASCSTIRQIDLKKIIAYSSVGHMNFVTIGLMSPNLQGVEGSIVLMISHGFVSSALFLCIGLLYDRYGTRLILYYGGLVYGMPIFSFLFLLFTLANVSLPGTSSFIGEILVLIGISSLNLSITGLAAVGIILGAVYAMWLYNRVIFGKLKIKYLKTFHDVNFREFLILLYLLLIICLVGVYPVILSDSLHLWAYDFLEHLS
jgi:proton-translocating NADH-quinone oxidoreductase chain M